MARPAILDPELFAESPMVAILVTSNGNVNADNSLRRTFYVHKCLIENESRCIAKKLDKAAEHSDRILIKVDVAPVYFKCFVVWAYSGEVEDGPITYGIEHLWGLASHLDAPSFKNYLIDKCKLLSPSVQLSVLDGLTARGTDDDPKLWDYILETLAFTIAKDGWVNFIKEAHDEWEDFMRSPDSLQILKAVTLSELMAKLQIAREFPRDDLVDQVKTFAIGTTIVSTMKNGCVSKTCHTTESNASCDLV
ncbi:hypothetical protein H2200_000295 [Cladophialophora chaetospira]|uniref:BTB domain-containing protein n=1 Tax=Cladophialophora chaetospira TaxID=386627 RepID=A0AA38XNH7_9EURO|nr:hypothetical protein H2200_000295 [Cladophialophora chaetospira]